MRKASLVNTSMKEFFSLNLDFAGFFTSSLCAVHCALLPILLGMGVISTEWMDHFWVEMAFLTLSLGFAFFSLVKSYLKTHRTIFPLTIAVTGFIIFITGLQFHGPVEIICTTIAGVLIATAHFINWQRVKLAKS